MIELKRIYKKFKEPVISDFSYIFNNGLHAIIGDSGSGKSTLLNIISGVDQNYQGEVKIDGVNLKHLTSEDNSLFRLKNIGYVFQDFRLLNLLSVFDNVLFNLDALSSLSKSLKEKMVKEALKFVGLENKSKKIVNTLSGGERQRVAIARAIVSDPQYLLCDEPTGSLDDKTANQIFSLIKKYSENHTVILVSHDEEKCLEYVDVVLYFQDGQIKSKKELHKIVTTNKPRIKIKAKEKVSLSFNLRLKTGLGKIKEKKWRSVFTNFVSSLSLLAIGLGIVISTSLKNEIIDGFANIVERNQIIVNKKSATEDTYYSYISASEESVNEVSESYQEYLYGSGVSYLSDFDSMFIDRNQVYLLNDDNKIILPAYHADKFNSYIWKEEKYVERFYPTLPDEIKINDIILGMTYQDMLALCSRLMITRDYESLGTFLSTHYVRLFLGIDNLTWGYDNDIEFRLLSVYPSLSGEIYHTHHFFNMYVFENEGHLPTTLDIISELPTPWTLKKVNTLHLTESPSLFIESISLNKKYDDLLFESAQNFLEDECVVDDSCPKNVVLVFMIDKNAIDISDVVSFKKIGAKIKSYYFSTFSGYQTHPSGMLSGFINNVAFSLSEDKVTEVGDYFSKKIEGELEEFSGVAIGGIAHFNEHSVLFSSDLSSLFQGEAPRDYNEIVVSTGLINYLGYKNNPLYEDLYYASFLSTLDRVVINHFKIVGIVEEDKCYIYHNPFFTISFFRDKLGVSSFNLIPTNVVINFEDGVNLDLVLNDLSTSFKEYTFSSPLKEIGASVDEVMKYVSYIAMAFSLIAVIISTLLLALISYLNALESVNEIKLLKHLGHAKRSIREYIVSHTLVMSLITTSIACISLCVLEFFTSFIFSNYFKTIMTLNFNLLPIVVIAFIGVFFPLLISSTITILFLKK